ncbi:MAG: YfiR family protein [Acidobacteriota bacterium]|nr:YfiR family protein [Acidobacteriota bacterium]
MALLRHARLVAALVLLIAAASRPAPAAAQDQLELEIRAVFLYNFARFVEFPASSFADAWSPIGICVVGADPFGETLDRAIAGETINGRPLRAIRIGAGQSWRACHIVYISRSEHGRLPATLDTYRTRPVVSVGEHDDFLAHGGIIRFRRDDKRLRFDVNLRAAERSGLRINSRLLSVAATVRRDPAP